MKSSQVAIFQDSNTNQCHLDNEADVLEQQHFTSYAVLYDVEQLI